MKSFLRRKYSEAFSYIYESRKFIYLAIFLFFLSCIVGFVFADKFSFFDSILKDLVNQIKGLSGPKVTLFIFFNNLWSSCIAIFLGVFLGLISIFDAISNGLILGYVLHAGYVQVGLLDFLRAIRDNLLPHGVFELPAILISIGLGIRFGMFIFVKKWKKEFVRRARGSLDVFVYVVIPLLVIAAVIEGALIALTAYK